VSRKGTRAARKIPTDFEEVKAEFVRKIKTCIKTFDIPDCLIINFDQTGIHIIPVGKYTMERQGAKQVELTGIDDKRQVMTGLLSITLTGDFMPPQILYKGKTEQCHPKYRFPNDWDIFHSENHWSNRNTMDHFIDAVLEPYIEEKRREIQKPDQQALCIFDVFAAHRIS
jgi:hypothetical protein